MKFKGIFEETIGGLRTIYVNVFHWVKKFRKRRLKIPTLTSQWCDMDEVLLHACFQVLVDFVEKELSQDIIDWDYDDQHREIRKEMQELYDWWKTRDKVRDEAHDKLFEGIDEPSFDELFIPTETKDLLKYEMSKHYEAYGEALKEYGDMLDRQEKEDDDNLIRLMKIRRNLWT